MQRIFASKFMIADLMVALPAVVHVFCSGSYVLDPVNNNTFWIGLSTTLPFAALAGLFLVHCAWLGPRRGEPGDRLIPRAAAWGAGVAWTAMMALTVYIVSHPAGPESSSTMAIAVMFTPFFYLPPLIAGYACGAFAGTLSARWPWTGRAKSV